LKASVPTLVAGDIQSQQRRLLQCYGIRLLVQPRRLKHYVNVPQCYVTCILPTCS